MSFQCCFFTIGKRGASIPVANQRNAAPVAVCESRLPDDRTRVYVAALVVLAALLRLLWLGEKSLWLDEGVSYAMAISRNRLQDSFWIYQALYHELLRGWILLGDSEFQIRLLSVIPSVATVPLVYMLGKRLFDRRIGLLSALLLTFHVAHITYSQQARSYGLVVFLCCLATCFLTRAVENGTWRDWGLYVLFSAMAVYSHFLACLVIPAQLLSFAVLPSREIPWRRLVPSTIALAALTLPSAILILYRGVAGAGLIPQTSRQLPHWISLLAGDVVTLPVYIVCWALAARQLRRTCSVEKDSWMSWRTALLVSWAVVPAILLALISLVQPSFMPRYLLVSAPAAIILAACGLAVLRLRPRFMLVLATIVLSFAALVYFQTRPKEDWRGAAGFVFAQAQPGDALLVLPPYVRWPFLYYRHRLAGEMIPLETPDAPTPSAPWLDHVAHYRRLWVLVYARAESELSTGAYENALKRRLHLQFIRRFRLVFVQLYSAAPTSR